MKSMAKRLICLAVAALMLHCPGLVAAQPVIQAPTEVPVGGLCIVRVDGLDAEDQFSWVAVPPVMLADLVERGTGRPVLFVETNKRGTIHLVLAYIDEGKIGQAVATIVIGPAVPDPDPDPDPEPDPIPVGKRSILVVRETADTTPTLARLVTGLRTGEHALYLVEKGHKLMVLDDDSVDAEGNPTPVLASWRPHFEGMTLPVVFVIDQTTNQLVHKQELPVDATAADVMAILKTHGG